MTELSPSDSRRKYSWWWNSHISPKNSKWLQENLTDMDAKVKAMIKLIEEDADSFARRAEMYYKKRPELMKLVEEFYRAYRALAERYDHATGVIRHAHKTIAEAFPNQVPLSFPDDEDPQTPRDDDLQIDYTFDEDSDSRGHPRARIRLDFDQQDEKQESFDAEALNQHMQSVETLAEIEDDVRPLNERAQAAETEVEISKYLETISSLERSNRSLQSELEKLTLKINDQNQQLTEKNKEFGRLWACIQEERLRLVEVEANHKQTRAELENQVQLFKDLEGRNQSLHCEVLNLEREFELQVGCLKDGMSDLNKKHLSILEQIHALGLDPETFGTSVKELRDDKFSLLERLKLFEQVLEKNSILENLLSDVSTEMEAAREKSKALESSFQSLSLEKSNLRDERGALVSQLEKLSAKNNVLENLLSDAHDEVQSLKTKSKGLEDSCRILIDQKDVLARKMETSIPQLQTLEKKKHAANDKIERLKILLDIEKQKHESYIDASEKQMAFLKSELNLLQEECQWRKKEFEEELDRASDSQIEIFILQESLRELEAKNISLERKHLEERAEAKESLSKAEEDNHQRGVQVLVLGTILEKLKQEAENLQVAYDNLEKEHLNLHENKKLLSEEFSFLEEKSHILEKEKSLQLEMLVSDIDKLREVHGETSEKLSSCTRMLGEAMIENLGLRRALEKLEDELRNLRLVNDKLNRDVEIANDSSIKNKLKLQEIEEKLSLTENKRLELCQNLEHQEKQIVELSAERNCLSTENRNLCEAALISDKELCHLHEENEKIKNQKEALLSELQKQHSEIKRLESEMEKLFGELQMYICSCVLYEQKFSELMARHERFEDAENNTLKSQSAALCPAIVSLSKCVSSLEKCTHGNEVNAVAISNSGNNPRGSESSVATDLVSELQGLEARLQAINKALTETEQLEEQKNASLHSKLKAAMKQIEELKSKNHVHRKSSRPTSGVPEAENTMLTKDIVLDQISDCSPYSTGKREIFKADNHTLELWDTADWNKSIGLTVCKAKISDPLISRKHRNSRRKSTKKPRSDHLGSDESGVDKSEVPKRSMDLRERSKRRVLERLNSNVQKLMNLRITVQDMRSKLETVKKSGRDKAVLECETLKGQLDDASAAIGNLFDLSEKLMKNLEGSSSSPDMKSPSESEENRSVGRRQTTEQARRVSEKIGFLQQEVQNVQFSLLKLDNERDNTGKTRMTEEKRRVLLRDYLYGVKTRERRKKATCCACCVQPTTRGD